MTRRSEYVATSIVPRACLTAPAGSQARLLLDAVLLGFGHARVTISLPDGQTFKLDVEYAGGANHMFTEQTEQ